MDLGRPYQIIVTCLVSIIPHPSFHGTQLFSARGVILLSTKSARLLEDEDEAPLLTQVQIGCYMKFK